VTRAEDDALGGRPPDKRVADHVEGRSWAGLDVHARSVAGMTLDAESGELRTPRLPGEAAKVVRFLAELPGPTRVAYETGPTGYALARAVASAGSGALWRRRGRPSARRGTS
jgi:hypothetical protein